MGEGLQPAVSVIMPAYNCAAFLPAAVASVQAQTVNNWELIIVDDHSRDDTLALARQLAASDSRIRVLANEQNLGVSQTRNRAIGEARGTFIACLDSDDIWLPRKLELQLSLLAASGADLCYCSYSIIDQEGKPCKADYIVPEQVDYEGLLRENVMQCSTMVMPAHIARKYPFTREFYHEDYVLGLSVLRDGGKAVGCAQVLSHYRHLENSRSANKLLAAKNRWLIYRDLLHLPLGKRLGVFLAYATAGLRKYTSRPKEDA